MNGYRGETGAYALRRRRNFRLQQLRAARFMMTIGMFMHFSFPIDLSFDDNEGSSDCCDPIDDDSTKWCGHRSQSHLGQWMKQRGWRYLLHTFMLLIFLL